MSSNVRSADFSASATNNNLHLPQPAAREISTTDKTIRYIVLAVIFALLGAAIGIIASCGIGILLGFLRAKVIQTMTYGTIAGTVIGVITGIFFAQHQISSVEQVDKDTNQIISLHLNENPFGCFPSVTAAMKASIDTAHRYVENMGRGVLWKEIAAHHSVQPEEVLMSPGLGPLLTTIAETFLGPKTKAITAHPTFDFFKIFAEARGSEVSQVPLKKDYSHDLDAMLAQVDASTKLVYICNPNNPTGTITPRSQIEEFIQKLPADVYVFIDEAYHHFALGSKDYVSFIDTPIIDDRVIVGRSFSKVYGLAGMRLGYIVSTPKTIARISKLSPIAPLNHAVICGGSAALKDETALQEMIQKIEAVRNEFYAQAKARSLDYIPSYANFVMLGTGGRPVQDIIKHFKVNNINIGREFPLMPLHVRISLGLPEQMERFWRVWDTLPQ